MSSRSLPGLVSESPRSSTIGFGGWLPNIIALRSSFLAGPSTGRAAAGAPPPQMNFLTLLFTWFGDPDPRIGTAWEKGERLAKLIAHRRTLLVLDGLEPLQNPPGPQEGRLREPSLQALLTRACCLQYGALRNYHAAAGRRYSRSRAHFSPASRPGTSLQRCRCKAAPSAGR